jgi:hypothetical protein
MHYLIAIVLCLLAGCSHFSSEIVYHTPTPIEFSQAQLEAYPKKYTDVIQQDLAQKLKDPFSLKIQHISTPAKSYHYIVEKIDTKWYQPYPDTNLHPKYGWRVCLTYMAKNSYGAYTGWRNAIYFFSDNQLYDINRTVKDFGTGTSFDLFDSLYTETANTALNILQLPDHLRFENTSNKKLVVKHDPNDTHKHALSTIKLEINPC